MFFYIVLTPISTTSGLWNTGNTRKYHQIDVYIYQCEYWVRSPREATHARHLSSILEIIRRTATLWICWHSSWRATPSSWRNTRGPLYLVLCIFACILLYTPSPLIGYALYDYFQKRVTFDPTPVNVKLIVCILFYALSVLIGYATWPYSKIKAV